AEAPMGSVVPSGTSIFRTPEAAAGTTLLALSVSSSKRGSPALTAAPSALSQRARMPSVIDSPTPGTVIATAAMLVDSLLQGHRERRIDVGMGMGRDQVGQRRPDGRRHQLGLLAVVDPVRAGRRAGAGIPADVLERRPRQLLEPGRDERPAPHVLRLLLDPDPLVGVPIARQGRL